MATGQPFTTRPQLAGTFGMVASTHWLASAAGMAVLESGGNAFDSAVATGLVLQIVEPHLNGPGGEVPVIGYSVSDGGVFVVDGQGTAPAAATLDTFAELGIDLIPGNGLLAATVPAAFGAWMLLLGRYGTLPLREVMSYAIGYAEHGYPMLPTASAAIEAMVPTFTHYWPTSAEIYLSSRAHRRPGAVLPIRHWPRPTAGYSPRRRRHPATGTARSRRPGGPGTRASSRRRSRATWPMPRRWMPPAAPTAGC